MAEAISVGDDQALGELRFTLLNDWSPHRDPIRWA
jgi:hypothetical protein